MLKMKNQGSFGPGYSTLEVEVEDRDAHKLTFTTLNEDGNVVDIALNRATVQALAERLLAWAGSGESSLEGGLEGGLCDW